MQFEDREEAGEMLSLKLQDLGKDSVVFAIPRGGVVVGKIIADRLNLPLEIVVIKKNSSPDNPELAIGAVGPKNTIYWDKDLCRRLGINKFQISNLKFKIEKERVQKERILRGERPQINVKNKSVILVDDGVATGATVICASKFLKKEKAKKVILAIPVIAEDTFKHLKSYFAKIVALTIEKNFYAVGQFYRNFPQVSDDEVIKILNLQ